MAIEVDRAHLRELLNSVVVELEASGVREVQRFPNGSSRGKPIEGVSVAQERAGEVFGRQIVHIEVGVDGWVLTRLFGSWSLCFKRAGLHTAPLQIAEWSVEAIEDAGHDNLFARPASPGVGQWIEVTAAVSVVAPFIQVLATKSGEDVYRQLRRLFEQAPGPQQGHSAISGQPNPTTQTPPDLAPLDQDVARRQGRLRTLIHRTSHRQGRTSATPQAFEPQARPPRAITPQGRVTRRLITDPETNTLLVLPEPVPDEALLGLASIDQDRIRGKILVWDTTTMTWEVR